MLLKVRVSRPPGGDKADWLVHREMGCDWLVAGIIWGSSGVVVRPLAFHL